MHMLTYLGNLLKRSHGDFTLNPHIAVYYVTMQCNLNCAYCEDFGSRRNHLVTPAPLLEDARHILKVIRSGMDRLWLTGGEPLLHPQLLDLLTYARRELDFREISLITNGTLLSLNRRLLPFLTNLVISLDSLDPHALSLVSVPDAHAGTVIANVREVAALQQEYNFRLILNTVLTPETLPGMDELIAFCTANRVRISFSPQSVNNLPRFELVTSPGYRAFIERVIQLKRQGAPILGSHAYFKTLLHQAPNGEGGRRAGRARGQPAQRGHLGRSLEDRQAETRRSAYLLRLVLPAVLRRIVPDAGASVRILVGAVTRE